MTDDSVHLNIQTFDGVVEQAALKPASTAK